MKQLATLLRTATKERDEWSKFIRLCQDKMLELSDKQNEKH